MKFLTTLLLICSFYFTSCKKEIKQPFQKNTNTSSNITYAKGFDIIKLNTYQTLLRVKAPYPKASKNFDYILTLKKATKTNQIHIPLKNIVVTSTTHIPMLDLLNVENKLVGFPNTNFISSKKTRVLIDRNLVTDLGNPENINTELLLNLKPQAVIGFSTSKNNKMFNTIKSMGIPVLLNGDWLEETPLGRAEWIKFFGVLFNKEKEADSIFKNIEKNYLKAKQIAKKATNKPTVVSGGLFKSVWYCPAGKSFEATFLKDAQTQYLWNNTKGTGSLSLNVENVFLKGKDADLWLSPSFHTSLNDLKKNNAIYPQFKAYKTGNVYSYIKTKGATGGTIYFELSPTRPDLVLKDIIKMAHPELLPNYNLTFYKKLN